MTTITEDEVADLMMLVMKARDAYRADPAALPAYEAAKAAYEAAREQFEKQEDEARIEARRIEADRVLNRSEIAQVIRLAAMGAAGAAPSVAQVNYLASLLSGRGINTKSAVEGALGAYSGPLTGRVVSRAIDRLKADG